MSWNNNGPWGPYGNKPQEKAADAPRPAQDKPTPPKLPPANPDPNFDELLHRALENFRAWHVRHNELSHVLIGVVALLLIVLLTVYFAHHPHRL